MYTSHGTYVVRNDDGLWVAQETMQSLPGLS